ncbi:calmodulin-binding transcription activator 4 [Cocos nucifera]|uniref:Calmodulin-binding transcription activator 4 n=1 Tax=Cocos nucifera TaxID=13894 RepID=A0A8K0ND94_COCNU|nr:calmodulin-binding transcription activator 4 [Cocos nucifera]
MQQVYDINVLQQEAHTRWLKPSEVLFILQNYERFPLTQEPPQRPPSGSMFLFNRRILRFFRKDGHTWRRKKDGRTVGEAHERLKKDNELQNWFVCGKWNKCLRKKHAIYSRVFSIKDLPFFFNRTRIIRKPSGLKGKHNLTSWMAMVFRAYGHIVLVHYRDVAESTSVNNAQVQGFTSGTNGLYEPYRSSCSPGSVEEVSSKFVIENLESDRMNLMYKSLSDGQSSRPEVSQALQKLAEQLSLDDDDNSIFFDDLTAYSGQNENLQDLDFGTRDSLQESHENLLHSLEFAGQGQLEEARKQNNYNSIQSLKTFGDHGTQQNQSLCLDYGIERKQSPSWKDMLELSSSSEGVDSHVKTSNCSARAFGSASPARNMFDHDALLSSSASIDMSAIPFEESENLTWLKAERRPNGNQISESYLSLQLSATRRFLLGSDNPVESPASSSQLSDAGVHHSSGASIVEANILLRKENSTDWMGTEPLAAGNNTYTPDFSGSWFDHSQFESSVGMYSSLTVAQKQRFSIHEICPEWAFAFERTKVIITGEFLCNPSECAWAVMFGDVEVPLEIVQDGVLRCQAPQLSPGKVTLCITSGNRESCSEVREFEFRAMAKTSRAVGTSSSTDATKTAEELSLLARLVQILLCGHDSLTVSRGAVAEVEQSRKLKTDDLWKQIIKSLQVGCENSLVTVEWIMQELLKDKLQHWISSKNQGNDGTSCLLSKQEQGIIHLISGLGYEWALNPILGAGVGINFRDVNGWTALHWAAYFGRENMVAELLAAGASAGAVTDPTPQDPVGKTPGFIASARGHKGLAGYLSEVALTSHLSSLKMEENEISKGSAEVEAERAVESISQRSVQIHVGGAEDELSLKDSLAAVRNAAQAAARIQAAFRAHSFRKRHQALSQDDYGMTQEDIQGLSAASKSHRPFHGSHDQKFDKAAQSIQKKYRGWKGRKDFLTLRQHVVKIQAHVRGHQVRRKYREILRAVSVVEKVVLRWRRRGAGLRGFRAEPELAGNEEEDVAKVFRKQKVDAALDEAMSRVLSMVDSPDARQQYRRMLERYRQAMKDSNNTQLPADSPNKEEPASSSPSVFNEVSLLLAVKEKFSHPLRAVGDMIRGSFKGKVKKPHVQVHLPPIGVPEIPHVDLPSITLNNNALSALNNHHEE